VKNTNNVRVVLQHLSGEAMDKDRFVFTITDTNGSMDWDNSLRPDEPVTFYAWHTDAGEAGLASRPDGNASGPNAVFSAVIAELTVPHRDRQGEGEDGFLHSPDRLRPACEGIL